MSDRPRLSIWLERIDAYTVRVWDGEVEIGSFELHDYDEDGAAVLEAFIEVLNGGSSP